jgi:hypothetical protein
MKFGVFMEFETKSAGSPALAFEQGFRLVDLAEA